MNNNRFVSLGLIVRAASHDDRPRLTVPVTSTGTSRPERRIPPPPPATRPTHIETAERMMPGSYFDTGSAARKQVRSIADHTLNGVPLGIGKEHD